jgi:D-glycero-D-manno-heptose 1,7-bisphosphate phosphatase
MNWAVFLDRDGVINEEVEYLRDPGQLALIPTAAQAIRKLNQCKIPVIVVTNQAGVARGYLSETDVGIIHRALEAMLEKEGARIDHFYFCPHHPTEGFPPYRVECDCRKPKPGLLTRAALDFNLDLTRSFLVGDKVSDLEAGRQAGCQLVLVQTGYGTQVWAQWAEPFQPHHVAHNLLGAAEWILH